MTRNKGRDKQNKSHENDAKKRKAEDMDKSKNTSSSSQMSQADNSENDMALRVLKLEGEIFELKNLCDKQQAQLDTVSKSNEILKNLLNEERYTTTILRDEINSLQQYSRKNHVRVFRVKDDDKDETSERSEELVKNIFSKELGLKFNSNDFEICHRVGQYREGADRAIIVKLVRRKSKNLVMTNRKKLAGKPISIAEDLTPTNVQRLHNVKNLDCVDQAWSKDGKIFAKNKNGKIKLIQPLEKLSERLFDVQSEHSRQPFPPKVDNLAREAAKSPPREDLATPTIGGGAQANVVEGATTDDKYASANINNVSDSTNNKSKKQKTKKGTPQSVEKASDAPDSMDADQVSTVITNPVASSTPVTERLLQIASGLRGTT